MLTVSRDQSHSEECDVVIKDVWGISPSLIIIFVDIYCKKNAYDDVRTKSETS